MSEKKFVAHLCLLRHYGNSNQFVYSSEQPRFFIEELKEGQPFVAFFDVNEKKNPLCYYFLPVLTQSGKLGTILCMEEEIEIIQRGDVDEQCCAE